MKLQSAVKKETMAVAVGTGIGCLLLIGVFLIFYLIFPESSVKFDYRVVLGALAGGAVAIANFFLMALTVQKVVNLTDREDAVRMMRVSYRNRMLMRAVWIAIAILAPCFQYAAGIIPLFIPGLVIKLRGARMGLTGDSPVMAAETARESGGQSEYSSETAAEMPASAEEASEEGQEGSQSAEEAPEEGQEGLQSAEEPPEEGQEGSQSAEEPPEEGQETS